PAPGGHYCAGCYPEKARCHRNPTGRRYCHPAQDVSIPFIRSQGGGRRAWRYDGKTSCRLPRKIRCKQNRLIRFREKDRFRYFSLGYCHIFYPPPHVLPVIVPEKNLFVHFSALTPEKAYLPAALEIPEESGLSKKKDTRKDLDVCKKINH